MTTPTTKPQSGPKPVRTVDPAPADDDQTTCPRCGESQQLAKVKGCVKCLQCGFKFDCNGW
jgi:ribosomal protein S27AE